MEGPSASLHKIHLLARLKLKDYGEVPLAEQSSVSETYDNIRAGIVDLLNAARSAAARNVNSIMTAAYWEIGRRGS